MHKIGHGSSWQPAARGRRSPFHGWRRDYSSARRRSREGADDGGADSLELGLGGHGTFKAGKAALAFMIQREHVEAVDNAEAAAQQQVRDTQVGV